MLTAVPTMIEKAIELKRNDVALSGIIFLPEESGKKPAMIIAHGLPSTPLPVQEKGYDELGRLICKIGLVSIVFNFSGCQGSGGFFSLENWMKDLNFIYNYIRNLDVVNPSQVGFLAFSMGTIPTIYYIAHLPPKGPHYPKVLIICACPADLSEKRLAELRLGVHLTKEAGGIRITDDYDSKIIPEFREYMPIKWIHNIKAAKFIIHGARDDLIDVKNAYNLYQAAHTPKELFILDEAGHKLRQDTNAIEKILQIISKTF